MRPAPLVLAFGGHEPEIGAEVFIAPGAVVAGQVALGRGVGIWFNAVLRGDMAAIAVGDCSNIQDLAMVHVDYETPTVIGSRVTVGHRAIIHGATVEDECLIGMGAVILNRARIGTHSLVAAGAVVREGFVVPPGSLVAGIPAQVRRELTPAEQERLRVSAEDYYRRAQAYAAAIK
uniref:Gamma carbonic anhydrase family protein n=1 Tax=candidate division WOR-3 bacterium TaxID=2052148 RepID=A0A7C4GEM2_UNCW3